MWLTETWETQVRSRHAPAHGDKLGALIGVADHGSGIVRKYTRHRWKVAYITIDHAEERDDGGLVGGDAVEVLLPFVS